MSAVYELPKIGSMWRHSNGNVYVVTGYTNIYTEQPDKYPVTVVYEGLNSAVWSRPASDWERSFKPFNPEGATACPNY